MKSRWIIGLLMTCLLAAFAGAQVNSSAQPAEGPASPPAQLQAPAGLQDGKTYPEQLEAVLEAMTAELGEIAQAAREGKISRAQAEYLSLERYYVALTRFQFLRTMHQDPPQGNRQYRTRRRIQRLRFPVLPSSSRHELARLIFPNSSLATLS